jgi:hypothetical protein
LKYEERKCKRCGQRKTKGQFYVGHSACKACTGKV